MHMKMAFTCRVHLSRELGTQNVSSHLRCIFLEVKLTGRFSAECAYFRIIKNDKRRPLQRADTELYLSKRFEVRLQFQLR